MNTTRSLNRSGVHLACAVAICIGALTCSANAATGSLPPLTTTSYQFSYIEIPGNLFLAPFMPTEQGSTAGFYIDSQGASYGFIWQDSKVTPLNVPDGNNTGASGINDHGQVVGNFVDSSGNNHDFIYSIQHGTWTILPEVPGLPLLSNVTINDAGIVVGSGFYGTTANVGFIWDGNSYSFFSVPGADETQGLGTSPLGMNDRGQICGLHQDTQGAVHGFIKDGSNYTTVDVPGADQTWCFGINNQGDVVGVYYVFAPDFQEHGYILSKGRFFTFPTPGFGALTGINDQGMVAGCYNDGINVPWHGFVATPHGKD